MRSIIEGAFATLHVSRMEICMQIKTFPPCKSGCCVNVNCALFETLRSKNNDTYVIPPVGIFTKFKIDWHNIKQDKATQQPLPASRLSKGRKSAHEIGHAAKQVLMDPDSSIMQVINIHVLRSMLKIAFFKTHFVIL